MLKGKSEKFRTGSASAALNTLATHAKVQLHAEGLDNLKRLTNLKSLLLQHLTENHDVTVGKLVHELPHVEISTNSRRNNAN